MAIFVCTFDALTTYFKTSIMKNQNQPSTLKDAKWRQVALPEPTLIQVKGGVDSTPQVTQTTVKSD